MRAPLFGQESTTAEHQAAQNSKIQQDDKQMSRRLHYSKIPGKNVSGHDTRSGSLNG